MKLKFSGQIWENSSNIKFDENLSRGSRVVPCGRTDEQTERQTDRETDRHDEANGRFCQFCGRA
jgi:hypothetical protein